MIIFDIFVIATPIPSAEGLRAGSAWVCGPFSPGACCTVKSVVRCPADRNAVMSTYLASQDERSLYVRYGTGNGAMQILLRTGSRVRVEPHSVAQGLTG